MKKPFPDDLAIALEDFDIQQQIAAMRQHLAVMDNPDSSSESITVRRKELMHRLVDAARQRAAGDRGAAVYEINEAVADLRTLPRLTENEKLHLLARRKMAAARLYAARGLVCLRLRYIGFSMWHFKKAARLASWGALVHAFGAMPWTFRALRATREAR